MNTNMALLRQGSDDKTHQPLLLALTIPPNRLPHRGEAIKK